MQLTPAQKYREALSLAKPKRNKYRAVAVKEDGMRFDSKAEHRRYCDLRNLEKAGEIESLIIHPIFYFRQLLYPLSKRNPFYEADFQYRITYRGAANTYMGFPGGKTIIEDVKASATTLPLFKLKCALMRHFHSIEVHIYDSKSGELRPTYFEKRKVDVVV